MTDETAVGLPTSTTEADLKPREHKVITQEYAQYCTQAGDTQYRLKVLESELNQINSKLYSLNQEAALLKKSPTDMSAENSLPPSVDKVSDETI